MQTKMTWTGQMITFHPMNEAMGFGKYKSLTPEKLLVLNPGYLVWAHDNVSFFKLKPNEYEKSKRLAETRLYEKRAFRPRSYGYADNEDMDYSDWTQSY